MEERDKNDEIKLGSLDFDGQSQSFYEQSFTKVDASEHSIESTINDDLNNIGYGEIDNTDDSKQNVSGKKYDENYMRVNIEQPDDAKTKRFVIWGAICFVLVVLPIIFHPLYEIYKAYKEPYTREDLIVETKNFQQQDIYNTTEATGLVSPESSVDVVARVDGYLQNTYFKEGDFIKQGQLLFKIEPNEYEIAVRAAKASVDQTRAVYDNSLQELERAKELIKENFISRSDYDGIVAMANRDKAALDEVQQSLARAQLNLNYTNIYSPLTGKAGKINLSDGNYVGLASGPLVNIAKTNPICVSFSMKSADVIKLKQANNGVLDLSSAKVEIVLSDDSKYGKIGKINFSDNTVAEDAATLSLKAVFDNSDNILIPGDYVKVIITPSVPIHKYLIPQNVTHGDALNGYYLWAYQDGVVKKLPIDILSSYENSWIVNSGLTDSDKIIVKSNQNIDYDGMRAKLKNEKK